MSNTGSFASWATLAYYTQIGNDTDINQAPLAGAFIDNSTDTAYGRKTHVGAFRTCWRCTNATWAGESSQKWKKRYGAQPALIFLRTAFKGGENLFNDHGSNSHNDHGHLDLGQFVFETQGQRWISDLGMR